MPVSSLQPSAGPRQPTGRLAGIAGVTSRMLLRDGGCACQVRAPIFVRSRSPTIIDCNFAVEDACAATPLPVVRPDYGCAKAQDVAREHPEPACAVESCQARTCRCDGGRPAPQGAAPAAQGGAPRTDYPGSPLTFSPGALPPGNDAGRTVARRRAGQLARAPLRPLSGDWMKLVAVRILVVDDDRAVRESLRRSLSFNGYSVSLAEDGVEALEMIATDRPDGLVLDVMMPRLDGLEVCRQLRSTGDDLPILVLTARDTVSERVAGLDAGADDYLPKPFALEELLARMRALLRRTKIDDSSESVAMTFADLTLDSVTREVTRGQRQISLTRTEFALLEMLIANPRRVLTRSRILEEVWGFDFPTSGNALEVYVGYLRRKTEADGEPRLIHTVRGVGYVLRETPP